MLTVNKVGYPLPIKGIQNNKPAFKSNEGLLKAIEKFNKNPHSGTMGSIQGQLMLGIKNTTDFAEKIRALPEKMKIFLLKLSEPEYQLKVANDTSMSKKERESFQRAYNELKPTYECLKEILGDEYQRLIEKYKEQIFS